MADSKLKGWAEGGFFMLWGHQNMNFKLKTQGEGCYCGQEGTPCTAKQANKVVGSLSNLSPYPQTTLQVLTDPSPNSRHPRRSWGETRGRRGWKTVNGSGNGKLQPFILSRRSGAVKWKGDRVTSEQGNLFSY